MIDELGLGTWLLLFGGFAALVAGAEILVRGASRLAAVLGVSPLVIGLTVVAFGTSSPELAVCLQSVFSQRADLAVGNIVGSNISNVLLILGLSAMVTPLAVARQLIRLDVPIMVGISLLTLALAWDGVLSAGDGIALLIVGAAYMGFTGWLGRRSPAETDDEFEREYGLREGVRRRWPLHLLYIGLGLVSLVLGSGWLVDGAVVLARAFGLSELVIGLTVVAVGTSMPELATSLVACLRREGDIAVGNVVGSNILNLVLVLGGTATLGSGLALAPAVLRFDLPIMIAVAVACLPIFYTGRRIDRWEGLLFFGFFAAYVTYLLLRASEHDALQRFEWVMVAFVLPLTAITLGVLAVRAFRRRRSMRGP